MDSFLAHNCIVSLQFKLEESERITEYVDNDGYTPLLIACEALATCGSDKVCSFLSLSLLLSHIKGNRSIYQAFSINRYDRACA